ncbi:MAG: response regulator [Candidatus Binatus sp.]|jgi:PAS domain S-box-containing protein|uniref:hybrid sensor histidine kinase/response regulator n=1 Tax=Candidatus Binatus sp. TaxID=2811406 RepID=UPI003C78E1C6
MKPQEASQIERIPAAAGMKASILLVDDRPANLLALEAILDPIDQHLVRAMSGEEALEKLQGEEFAVILMDVRMPGMDGLRTAEVISRRESAARIPIIFLTAVPIANADVVSGYERGAVDFLLKPFDPEILRSKVSVFVDLYQKEQMIKRQAGLLRQRDREAFERRSELRFRSLMDALPQCVWVARADQTFYYWNQRAAEYIGLQASVAVGADRLFEFVHADDIEMTKTEWRLATSLQRSSEVRIRLRRHSDGAYRWFLLRGVPQRDESGKVTGWIVAATDIDAEHQALEKAEDANRMKEEFLATVSHELRNPLNAIVGWIHLLRSGNLDAGKSSKALETVERNVHLQTALIDDILDVSRISRGKINMTFRAVPMRAVVDAALAAVRPTADAKGIALEFEMTAQADEVRGDPDRLQQIVWNLLSNAIKFTPRAGRITVRIEQREDDLTLAVHDTGQGISPDFLPRVFDRFSQADSGSTRAHGGLGLGLSIVRNLVELHAGTVEATSDGPGKGATFSIRLPLLNSRAATAASAEVETGPKPLKLAGVSILVVDDEIDSREVLAELLRYYGAQTVTAASAAEALAEIARSVPAVLVSDIGMPAVDGYQFIRAVRERIPEQQMIALALTGLGSGNDKERALAEGFQRCIVKPVEPEQLVETIEHLLISRSR